MTGRRALAGITFAAAAALAAGAATAQVPYQIGDDRGNVTVDMGVLESLGPEPTVPEMLRPGTPVGEYGYDPRAGSRTAVRPSQGSAGYPQRRGAPSLGVDSAPAPDWLRRPDAPRYAPLPETLSARSAPRTDAPALTPPSPAARATAPTLRPPEPSARAAAPAPEPSAPPPARSEPQQAAARPAAPEAAPPPSAPPPPKPSAATAEAAPPPPAARAPEPPKAPPPPALPAASAPEPDKDETPAEPEPSSQMAAATPGPSSEAPEPSAQGADGDVVRVPFDANQSALPGSAASELDKVVARLRDDDSLRVQLLAYADGDDDNANKARRLSLSRALAVRAYLIDKQIQSTRMDVRALGNRTKDSPKDRVDVVLVSR